MEIHQLIMQENALVDPKTAKCIDRFERLLEELNQHSLDAQVIDAVNSEIAWLAAEDFDKKWGKRLKKTYEKILSIIEKETKLVPANYYRNRWMILGMTCFGVPFGVGLGTSLGNLGFMGIGFPIGMSIGIAIGSQLDRKAKQENRQIALEA